MNKKKRGDKKYGQSAVYGHMKPFNVDVTNNPSTAFKTAVPLPLIQICWTLYFCWTIQSDFNMRK